MVAAAQTLRVKTNNVFAFLDQSPNRISSLRGGTRSGKTYNALLWWIRKMGGQRGKILTIARQTMPALRASAMRDFFSILERLRMYDPNAHNKTANEYTFGGNLVEFIGLNESMRVRGRKRDYLFLNEANECDVEAFRQLSFRTTEKIVLDYNPSEAFSWVYDQVETREDCDLLVTTYKDNPFLEPALVAEIERLQDADQDYWKVYGLGQIASGGSRIFTHWRETGHIPEKYEARAYGLDFGYNHPTALSEVTLADGVFYWREMLYETKLTTFDLIEKLKTFPELRQKPMPRIIADSAEPKTIQEIKLAGFNVEPAYKDVMDTINWVKANPLRVDAGSANLLRELKRYSWKTDRNGKVTDEVVKFDDDLADSCRYATYGLHFSPKHRLIYG